MGSGYKRDAQGRFNGGYGKGALGGKGAYAGQKPRVPSGQKASAGKSLGKTAGARGRAAQRNRNVGRVAVAAGLATYGVTRGRGATRLGAGVVGTAVAATIVKRAATNLNPPKSTGRKVRGGIG